METIEAQLLKACLDNEPDAFSRLYEHFAPAMYGLCLRYSRSKDFAADILHDGFLKVFDNLKSLRPDSSLSSWIRSIMVNTAINYIRRERFVDSYDEPGIDVTRLPDDVDDAFFRDIDTNVILDAIQHLPDSYRVAFNLIEIEGFSYPDAALKTGLTQSSVRANVTRAKHLLRKALAPHLKPGTHSL